MSRTKKVFLVLFLLTLLSLSFYFLILMPIYISKVEYELLENRIYATVTISKNVINPICITEISEIKAKDHKCHFEINEKGSMIKIKSPFYEISRSLIPDIHEVVDFTLKETKIYLAQEERKEILFSVEKIGSPKEDVHLKSRDENIVRVEKNEIIGISPGVTSVEVTVSKIKKEVEVIVTDLITIPKVTPNKKFLPCGIYTEEQNKLLDSLLEYRVQEAGYQTRAGVVAALRFLTLEFPYQLNYFFESGRLNNNTGGNYVDGEGRFYHKGLFLNKNKYNELVKTKYGPAIWGCPLTNWQDEAGFVPGVRYPNGLDCSGFITWAFYNGGFDVGDTGAGDNLWRDDDLSDLGPHVKITREVLTDGKLKAGDIIAADGHIAMVGGIHDGIIYVAESTTYYKGVVMHPYTIDELLTTDYLNYVIYMDDYYQNNGNYKEYWEK